MPIAKQTLKEYTIRLEKLASQLAERAQDMVANSTDLPPGAFELAIISSKINDRVGKLKELIKSTPGPTARNELKNLDITKVNGRLNSIMIEKKAYLDSDLSLRKLADAVQITPHQLSDFLNRILNSNFYSYINKFRIEEAKRLLRGNQNLKIIHVAYESGFRNKSSFNSSFLELVGMSPSDFVKLNQE